MLKPKKKITRKEIKRDPFLESIFSVKEHFNLNQKRYSKLLFGILAVVILATLYMNNLKDKENSSTVALGKAMVFMDQGDYENTLLNLQNIVDEFNGTRSGVQANYYLGRLHFDRGNYSEAEPYLEFYTRKGKTSVLRSAACEAMAHIYAVKEDYSQAVYYQGLAVKYSGGGEREAMAKLKYAEFTLMQGDSKAARNMVENIIKTWSSSFDIKQKAEELSGRIYVGNDP